MKIIRASLQGASITTQTVDAQAFIDIVGEMINHNPDSLYPKRRQLDPYSDLNYQCVEDSFDLKVRADYLTLGLRESGRNSTARILNFHLARNPEIAFLWNMARQLQQPAEPGVVHLLPVHPDADSGGGRPGENPQRSQPEVHGPRRKSRRPPMPNGFRPWRKKRRSGGGTASAAGLRSVLCRVLLPQHHSLLQGQ